VKAPYFQVDAFTNKPFSGNPAGVCLLDRWLPDDQLQLIARENGLPETAFVVREKKSFSLRWFTPSIEVDLCGHATLAAAHVLGGHLGFSAPWLFHSRSGTLTVSRTEDLLTLDFPSRPGEPVSAPSNLLEGLGAIPEMVMRARDYLAVFSSEDQVRDLRPDFAALARLDCLGIIATAPGSDCDFVSRFFAPGAGIPEDPVTGSAHCTLMPYWADRCGREKLFARQISERGGKLWCERRGDRILIGGHAVTYLEGQIVILPK
jgi:PhzF family phenazine biosynthesis protein